MKTIGCGIKGCPIRLIPHKSGFEVKLTLWVLDRKDRDADAFTIEDEFCSADHLKAGVAELAKDERFASLIEAVSTEKGKQSRK